MLVISNPGERLLLDWALRLSTAPALKLKLYSNDWTPDADTVVADLTECTFGGYSAHSLTRAAWIAATTDTDGTAKTAQSAVNWTVSSSGNVYGYWVETDEATPVLVWAERFGIPRAVESGDTFSLTPKLSFSSR